MKGEARTGLQLAPRETQRVHLGCSDSRTVSLRAGRYRIFARFHKQRTGRPSRSSPVSVPSASRRPSPAFYGVLGLRRARTCPAFPSRIEVFTSRQLIIRGTTAGARISGYNLARPSVSAARGRLNFAPTRAIRGSRKTEITSRALRARENERARCALLLRGAGLPVK